MMETKIGTLREVVLDQGGPAFSIVWEPELKDLSIRFYPRFWDVKRKETLVIVDGLEMSMHDADKVYLTRKLREVAETGEMK